MNINIISDEKMKKLIKWFIPGFMWPVLNSILYYGSTVTCPICGGNFRRFLPRGSRKGVFCPRCGAKERHRLLWLYLLRVSDIFDRNLKMLHFAPEPFFQSRFKKSGNIDYISADLYSPRAMIKQDITSLTLDDNTFDVIFCSHVLEHVEDDKKAMGELFRVLKPDGWAMIQVPLDINRQKTYEDPSITSPEAREKAFGQHDHVRHYGLDIKNRLSDTGFSVDQIDYLAELPRQEIEIHGLDNEEYFYICKKPA